MVSLTVVVKYCKKMVPEYSKAALGLHPLIPLYAVDCDENRSLCAEQGVKGFPTVKLFPRGKEQASILFEHSDRTASAFFYFATRRVPHKNKKLYSVEEIEPWVNNKIDQTRVLLLSKAKDIPLMWKVLANKYRDDFTFANHRDRKGKSSEALGYDAGTQKESKILVYPAGSANPLLFEGVLKYNSISDFFNSILDGTAKLTAQTSRVPEDSHKPTPEEKEIERKQEAQRLALLHGGFSDIIDFEKAMKEHGTDFHEAHGHTARSRDTTEDGQMGDSDTGTYEREDPIHRAIRIQLEKEREAKDAHVGSLRKTGETDQRTATETPLPFATINMKAPLWASETCISKSVKDNVVPSCASPVFEREALPINEDDTASQSGHAKDEL
jgi:protein disulfide-isomerase A6